MVGRYRAKCRTYCCSIFSDRVITKGRPKYGGVAQLGEHLPCKQGVMGSIPIISTRPGVRAAGYRVEISEIDSVSPDGMRTETMKEIANG